MIIVTILIALATIVVLVQTGVIPGSARLAHAMEIMVAVGALLVGFFVTLF